MTRILTILVLPEYLSGRTSVCDIWPDITTNFFGFVALFYEYLSNKMLNNGFWSALIIGEALKTFLGTNGYIRI